MVVCSVFCVLRYAITLGDNESGLFCAVGAFRDILTFSVFFGNFVLCLALAGEQ